jgi:hypothetical protein
VDTMPRGNVTNRRLERQYKYTDTHTNKKCRRRRSNINFVFLLFREDTRKGPVSVCTQKSDQAEADNHSNSKMDKKKRKKREDDARRLQARL